MKNLEKNIEPKVLQFIFLKENEEQKVLQFATFVFGVNSSPFHEQFLSKINAIKKISELPEASDTALCSMYMDDRMDSHSNNVKSIKQYRRFFKIMKKRWYVHREIDTKFNGNN